MYRPAPDPEELAAIGLLPEDVEDNSVIEVWEENWQAFEIFSMLSTQWRVGMAGPTGMDYAILPIIFDGLGIKPKRRLELLGDLQIMEREALRVMSSDTKKK